MKIHLINPMHPDSNYPWCREGLRQSEEGKFKLTRTVADVTCAKCKRLINSRKAAGLPT